MSPFETHKPVLEYALLKQGRYVLEVGGGEASTPLIVKHSTRSLTIENNLEWYEKISGLGDDKHRVQHSPDLIQQIRWTRGNYDENHYHLFSLALVDNDNWKERCEIVTLLKGVAEVILLHDSFNEHLNRCGECGYGIPEFKYRLNLYPEWPPRPEYPPTLMLSDTVDVTKWETGLTIG